MGDILIGTSGFSFDDWVGVVYPADIKKHEMLPYYEKSLGFKALEVNYTYYSMPSMKTMESFARRTSRDFSFIVKAHKSMTHEKLFLRTLLLIPDIFDFTAGIHRGSKNRLKSVMITSILKRSCDSLSSL